MWSIFQIATGLEPVVLVLKFLKTDWSDRLTGFRILTYFQSDFGEFELRPLIFRLAYFGEEVEAKKLLKTGSPHFHTPITSTRRYDTSLPHKGHSFSAPQNSSI